MHPSMGKTSLLALKVLKVSEWDLISVGSSLAQQCLGREGEETARSSRACEFLWLLQVFSLFSAASLASLLERVTHWYQNKTDKRGLQSLLPKCW